MRSIPAPSDSDLGEFHPWDPHKAMKCIEVGDFYFKQGNYRAAISRYQEALDWKPKDAEATYKLGEAQEKSGDFTGGDGELSGLPQNPAQRPLRREGAEGHRPPENQGRRERCLVGAQAQLITS